MIWVKQLSRDKLWEAASGISVLTQFPSSLPGRWPASTGDELPCQHGRTPAGRWGNSLLFPSFDMELENLLFLQQIFFSSPFRYSAFVSNPEMKNQSPWVCFLLASQQQDLNRLKKKNIFFKVTSSPNPAWVAVLGTLYTTLQPSSNLDPLLQEKRLEMYLPKYS